MTGLRQCKEIVATKDIHRNYSGLFNIFNSQDKESMRYDNIKTKIVNRSEQLGSRCITLFRIQ